VDGEAVGAGLDGGMMAEQSAVWDLKHGSEQL
jgi:hypothetical protein